MNIRKTLSVVILTALLMTAAIIPASADSYDQDNYSFIYNQWGEAVEAPAGYTPEIIINGGSLGISDFKDPMDIFVHKQGKKIYVADTGNNRIVILNADFTLFKVLAAFDFNGQTETLKNPNGVFVDADGLIYIADTDKSRVLVVDINGQVKKVLERPATDEMKVEQLKFFPHKVVVGKDDVIYVLSGDVYQGAMMYDENGKFLGFFGSNSVESTLERLNDLFWRLFMTKSQIEKTKRNIPVEYSNFFVDDSGFIYTVTASEGNKTNFVRKLNGNSSDVLNKALYGKTIEFGDTSSISSIVDITVEENGFFTIVDQKLGRLFQYDNTSNLLMTFGGKGYSKGQFLNAVSVDSLDGRILVLDSMKKYIAVFKLTEYGKTVRTAVELYNDGLYQQASSYWYDTLRQNSNMELAYVGIARNLFQQQDYRGAMEYFKKGYNRSGYSEAFKEFRTNLVRDNFSLILISILLILALFFILRRYLYLNGILKRERKSVYQLRTNITPFNTMFHPFDGFNEMRWYKNGSVVFAGACVAAFFLLDITSKRLTGFTFNPNRVDAINIFYSLLGTVGLFATWVTANWSFSTLTDGEGTFKDIAVSTAYSLVPYMVSQIIVIIMSNWLVLEEGVFLQYVTAVGLAWSGMLIVSSMSVIHQYSLAKTIVSIIYTVAGIGVVIFLLFLLFSLFQEISGFMMGLIREIIYRL